LRFEVKIRNTLIAYINTIPEKSRRIIKKALEGLEQNPYAGSGGDKEKLNAGHGREIFRIHIARTYTAFYSPDTENRIVRVHEILTIEQAHKKYGRL
jgi:mRNA-degrading endonuclease RelE of RelBE toxin-antitoxin system